MSTSKTVVVTGATGKQGGAVAAALLAKGHRVRALTRDPNQPAARGLGERGAELVAGDFGDPDSLRAATRGADAVFAMGTPFVAGMAAETAQGIALIDAAARENVGHVVYTSVASADRATGIPHFDSKFEVEQHLRGSGVPFTILAPVYFMENIFFGQTLDYVRAGTYATPLPVDRMLQQIAVDDIGAFAAHVIDRGDAFLGQRIELAGDELSAEQSAVTLAEIFGRPVAAGVVPMEQIRAFSEDMALMYEWFVSTGYAVDIAGLRASHPEIGWQRFADWARGALSA